MLFLAMPSLSELWPILLIVVVLFGAKKLPALARAMGSSINQFKAGLADAKEEQEQLDESSTGAPKEGE